MSLSYVLMTTDKTLAVVLNLLLGDIFFFQEQCVFIIKQYLASHSYACVVDEFQEKYPGVAVLKNTITTRLVVRFREFGTVRQKKKKKSGNLPF